MTTASGNPELDTRPSTTGGDGDTLDHLYCETNHDLSLCGTDISDNEEMSELVEEDLCVVCDDLCDAVPCVVCKKEH